MPGYDDKEVKRLFGLSASIIRTLRRNRHIQPSLVHSRLVYSFQDLVILRTVRALRAANISTRAINRALLDLQGSSTEGSMSRYALTNAGKRIQVREGLSRWELPTGQFSLALESESAGAHIRRVAGDRRPMKDISEEAHQHFVRGLRLEDSDIKEARAAYEACLAGDCTHLEARINLGRILHLAGLFEEAEKAYRGTREADAVLLFNLAVLLEDRGQESAAVATYQQAIAHDPRMADAHYNLSLLHERTGAAQAAFCHLLAYRRLMGGNVTPPTEAHTRD
jgi:tetratricopeptide (TPR) repeat protein